MDVHVSVPMGLRVGNLGIHTVPYAYKVLRDFIFANFVNQWAFAKNVYPYSISLLLQAAFHEIKIAKIVRCGAFAKYTSRGNLYPYSM